MMWQLQSDRGNWNDDRHSDDGDDDDYDDVKNAR
jgi:hypothetical protein